MASNVVPLKTLRSFVGLATHFASVLFAWRPFLTELCGAVATAAAPQHSQPSRGGCPTQCVWTRQIRHTLCWMRAFLDGSRGVNTITYSVDAFLGTGTQVRIVGDASPWGLGAYRLVDGSVASWYSCPMTPQDDEVLRTAAGSFAGQHVWQALKLLVALRLWARGGILTVSVLR